MNICLFGASSDNINECYFKEVEELGKMMASRGHGMVFGGGATGLMGAAARGLTEAGGKSIGIAPRFFNEPGVLFQNCTEFIFTETMRERKQNMEDLSDAFIIVPGGIGTFEELLECLTWKQLGLHSNPVVILNVDGYYDRLLSCIDLMVEEQMMRAIHKEMYVVVTRAEDVLPAIMGSPDWDPTTRRLAAI
jgi:uncharacterized protein (TIGR00730 family)